jgi:hypothetical protein
LNENPYVPSPVDEVGNRQPRIRLWMHDSASDAPAPDHVRRAMFAPVTAPFAATTMFTDTEPARLGFAFSPYS